MHSFMFSVDGHIGSFRFFVSRTVLPCMAFCARDVQKSFSGDHRRCWVAGLDRRADYGPFGVQHNCTILSRQEQWLGGSQGSTSSPAWVCHMAPIPGEKHEYQGTT